MQQTTVTGTSSNATNQYLRAQQMVFLCVWFYFGGVKNAMALFLTFYSYKEEGLLHGQGITTLI